MKQTSQQGKRRRRSFSIKLGDLFHFRIPTVFITQFWILLCTAIWVVLLFPYTKSVQLFDVPKVGEVAKETIVAPITFDIIRSHEEVERERKKVMEQVLLIVDYDPAVLPQVEKKIVSLQKSILKLADPATPDSIKSSLQEVLSREISYNALSHLQKRPQLLEDVLASARMLLESGVLSVLLVPSMERLTELRTLHNAALDQHLLYDRHQVTLRKDSLESTVRVNDIPIKEIALENEIKRMRINRSFDDEALNTVYEVLFANVRPNVTVNGDATLERRQKASLSVLEISGKVLKDSEIIRKHQEVSPDAVKKLRSLKLALERFENQYEKRKITSNNIGRVLLILLPLLFSAWYLVRYEKKLIKNVRHVLALSIICCLQIAIFRGVSELLPRLFDGSELMLLIPEYLIPLTTGSILVAILFGRGVGFVFSLFIAVYFGSVMGFSLYFFIYAFLSGIIAGLTAQNIRYRWHFFKIIPTVFLLSALIVTMWHLTGFKLSLSTLFMNCGLAFIGVVIAVFLAMVLITIFEHMFDVTTNMTLVELSDLNHPILKRLSIEAAGTYNHSVLVGNLAESAAQKIGANSLFARVASYYHDIGKIEKSDYFVENCLTVDRSRHTKLAPSMSALIICSHVKDGVELAKKYRVPKSIQDVIMQHHGTSMVSFFYEKALEQDPHKQVQEQEFRYTGPVPQTRESAIIMLADSVEAASRSLGTSSPKLLRELVKKIIRDKFLSSQLDQSDLTLRDLDEIVDGFMPVLQGIFHSRIEYPSKDKEKERERVSEKEQ